MKRYAALTLAVLALPVLIQGPAVELLFRCGAGCGTCAEHAAAAKLEQSGQPAKPNCCHNHKKESAADPGAPVLSGVRHCCCKAAPLDVTTTAGRVATLQPKTDDGNLMGSPALAGSPVRIVAMQPSTGPPPGMATVSSPGRPLYLRNLVLLT